MLVYSGARLIAGEWNYYDLMRFLYQIDAADNLFPSIHCLVSWLCWIGVRRRLDLPAIYRHFSLAAAVAVCISTMTTRQHVLADVFGGVFLAEFCYFLAGRLLLSALYCTMQNYILKNVNIIFAPLIFPSAQKICSYLHAPFPAA